MSSSVVMMTFPIYGKNVPNHQPVYIYISMSLAGKSNMNIWVKSNHILYKFHGIKTGVQWDTHVYNMNMTNINQQIFNQTLLKIEQWTHILPGYQGDACVCFFKASIFGRGMMAVLWAGCYIYIYTIYIIYIYVHRLWWYVQIIECLPLACLFSQH